MVDTRKGVNASQKKNAEGMLKLSTKNIEGLEIDDVVAIAVPPVDRAKVDENMLLARVVGLQTGSVKLGTNAGMLPGYVQFGHCKKININYKECPSLSGPVSGNKISLKKVAAAVSSVGGQGFIFCACKGTCNTTKCKCKKAGLACGSRCHQGHDNKNCKNKHDCAVMRSWQKAIM